MSITHLMFSIQLSRALVYIASGSCIQWTGYIMINIIAAALCSGVLLLVSQGSAWHESSVGGPAHGDQTVWWQARPVQ